LCVHRTNKLIKHGIMVFSPIAHSVLLSKKISYAHWMALDTLIMKHCDGAIIVDDHKNSVGCAIEKGYFKVFGKELLFYSDIGV